MDEFGDVADPRQSIAKSWGKPILLSRINLILSARKNKIYSIQIISKVNKQSAWGHLAKFSLTQNTNGNLENIKTFIHGIVFL